MSVGRGLMPEAYCGGAFRLIPSLSMQTKKRPNGCKDSANREQNIKLA